jgi:DNA polymerase
VTTLSLDYEGGSEVSLVGASSVGLWNYARHPTTRPFMAAYAFDDDQDSVSQLDFTDGDTVTAELKDALLDPHVEKWAFNAAFERRFTRDVLKIATPTAGWRCTMVLGFMRSFKGSLGDMGEQLGLTPDAVKDKEGKRLIRLFCMPQRITKNQQLVWRDRNTDPEDWQLFLDYNRQDVVAEIGIKKELIRYPILASEWRAYEADQEINDRGLPVNREFVTNANEMVVRRKAELRVLMESLTGLENPNSVQKLLPWLQDRGYRWADLQKHTIAKALEEHGAIVDGRFEPGPHGMDLSAVACLKLRQQASKTSVSKYPAMLRRLDSKNRLRHCFQFGGASRTNRWAGRGPQPQNLTRTPKLLSAVPILEMVTSVIGSGDYDVLGLCVAEPMTALSGLIRSSFQTEPGQEFVVADLAAIESAVIAWLSGCGRLLKVFRDGRDPYRDFGTELYNKGYDDITPEERGICKPPTLGCGFGLGGGREINLKKTGLWGYAENMGVRITQNEAHRQVRLFRDIYPEIPEFWKKIERAQFRALAGHEENVNGLLNFTMRGNFLTMELPSKRLIFYYRPKIKKVEFIGKTGEPYTRDVFTCMGIHQATTRWMRTAAGGPKVCENAVQGTARDILVAGVLRARDYGFSIVGTVHDEIIAQRPVGSNYLSVDALISCMTEGIHWTRGLPLRAAGYSGAIYRKD